ncbi:MAG: hypothetical protein JNN32_06925 [Flavobacteriales bacterium]|nr:hypothetical protein [Flavobacteriales bacterium]
MRTVEVETTTMPLLTHRTKASALRMRPARPTAAPKRPKGSGKADHDHRSTGLGWDPTPRLRPLPHPNELSRELGWVQRGGGEAEQQHAELYFNTVTAPNCDRPRIADHRIAARALPRHQLTTECFQDSTNKRTP